MAVDGQVWTVHCYRQDLAIVEERFLLPAIGALLAAKNLANFRQQIHLQTVPLLLAVDYNTRQISLLSPRGHRELSLLQRVDEGILSESERTLYRQLQRHVQRAQAMDFRHFPRDIDKLTATRSLPQLDGAEWTIPAERMAAIREKLLAEEGCYRRSWFECCSDYGLALTARYDLVRVHLLKFVALLSSLDFDSWGGEVKQLLAESLRRFVADGQLARRRKLTETQKAPPRMLEAGFRLLRLVVVLTPAWPLALWVRWAVKLMARRFIAGESLQRAEGELSRLLASGRDVTLDQLGELVVSAREADHYLEEILKLIRYYGQLVPAGERNRAGINRAHISIKVSALCHDFNPFALDYSYRQVAPRLRQILEQGQRHQVFINVDAEHYHYRDAVFAIYRRLLLEQDSLASYRQTGIVVQAYLRDAHEHLQQVIELAKRRQLTMPIRLVKGAYWDAETVEADAHSYDAPEFVNKGETDIHYRQLVIEILRNHPHVQLCVGGHNLDDHCYSEVVRGKVFFSHSAYRTPVFASNLRGPKRGDGRLRLGGSQLRSHRAAAGGDVVFGEEDYGELLPGGGIGPIAFVSPK